MIYSWKIQDGNNDGSHNSFTGDTINKNTIDIGNWMFVNSYGVFRFPIDIANGTKIEYALLTIYLEDTKGKISTKQDIQITCSDEINAFPLQYGLDRQYYLYDIKYNDIKLVKDDFNSFEITPLIKYIINKPLWKKGNYIAIKVNIPDAYNEIFQFGSADLNNPSSAIITIQYDEIELAIKTKINHKESVLSFGNEKIDENVIIGDLPLHPERISYEFEREPNFYSLGKDMPTRISISERMDFESGNKLLSCVGKILPFKCQEKKFNCIVESITADYDINYVNVSLSLIHI
jgi:hypothetical protein